MSNLTSLLHSFEHSKIVIGIYVAINIPNEVKRREDDCMFIARYIMQKYTLYYKWKIYFICYSLRIGFSIRKGKSRYYSWSKNIRKVNFYILRRVLSQMKILVKNRLETRTSHKTFIHFIVENNIWTLIQEHSYWLV